MFLPKKPHDSLSSAGYVKRLCEAGLGVASCGRLEGGGGGKVGEGSLQARPSSCSSNESSPNIPLQTAGCHFKINPRALRGHINRLLCFLAPSPQSRSNGSCASCGFLTFALRCPSQFGNIWKRFAWPSAVRPGEASLTVTVAFISQHKPRKEGGYALTCSGNRPGAFALSRG